MILPLTHEDLVARRWPLVTIGIIALSVVVFGAQLATRSAGNAALLTAAGRLVQYWDDHPYLAMHAPCDVLVRRAPSRAHPPPPPDDDAELATEQATLDALCAEVDRGIHVSPEASYGWVPARRNWVGLVTHQFLHGGVLHLVFNMWFLWLCGCNLEDRWGRAVFAPFYLSAGVAAALVHMAALPGSAMPMIGASGAIAGAMGAFLVSFARTRIRFFYFLLFKVGTFTAPAFVMLPLWIAQEVAFALMSRGGPGDGVAHWAHVGGFAYGAMFAVGMRLTGFEASLDRALERKVSTTQDERIMRAAEMTTAGDAPGAVALLGAVAGERPDDVDVYLELLRAAKAAGDRAREGEAYGQLVRLYVEMGALETASDLVAEAAEGGRSAGISLAARARLGDRLVVQGQPERAWSTYASITGEGLVDTASVRVALAQAKLARRLGRPADGKPLLEAVLASPFSTAGDRRRRARGAGATGIGRRGDVVSLSGSTTWLRGAEEVRRRAGMDQADLSEAVAHLLPVAREALSALGATSAIEADVCVFRLDGVLGQISCGPEASS